MTCSGYDPALRFFEQESVDTERLARSVLVCRFHGLSGSCLFAQPGLQARAPHRSLAASLAGDRWMNRHPSSRSPIAPLGVPGAARKALPPQYPVAVRPTATVEVAFAIAPCWCPS